MRPAMKLDLTGGRVTKGLSLAPAAWYHCPTAVVAVITF